MTEHPIPFELRRSMLRRGFLPIAVIHVTASLDTGGALLGAGFPSAAFVWAVRSAEILFREMILFPIHFEQMGDARAALKKAREDFKGGDWKNAFELAREHHGVGTVDDPPITEEGADAWAYWLRQGVGRRHDIVHGRDETDEAAAKWAIGFADRMRTWVTVRLVAGDEGPFAGLLAGAFEEARRHYREERGD